MVQTIRPPFRADHVGSLLWPERLKEARESLLGAQTADAHLGPHGNERLAKIEDECIRDVIAMQEKTGLSAATDGEFRRRSWWLELIMTPEDVLADYARRMNATLEGLPDDLTITMHQCRGNREGLWSAAGGYDPVADVLFNQINVHGYFLEYDTPRAGTFEPLRLVPDGKVAALGIVSTKTGVVEDADYLKRRIDDAAKFAPLERLSLATQCGFASSIVGNPLSEDDQAAKLARIVEVADDVWGTA